MAKHYNFIYEKLVRYDGDMVGRVAYSLYKREKIAFIEQYKKSHDGKEPSAKDFDNFHESCHNPERLQSYHKEALAMLQDFVGESFEETSKQILTDFTKVQDDHLAKVIKPLLPQKSKIRYEYLHGILQSMIGSILLPVLIGIILFAFRHSINEIWIALAEFFNSLAQ
jgi:hypothetical protein